MKSMLVALDDTPAAAAARQVALALAEATGARITGIGVLDVDSLTAPEPTGIGGSYYKARMDETRLNEARERMASLIATFEAECRQRQIKGQALEVAGDPLQAILETADGHDLIVVGRDTAFRLEPVQSTSRTVERLLKQNPRPILLTPAEATTLAPVLVAYDGSIVAARALQMFALLQLVQASPVHVVSVHEEEAGAIALAERAERYLELYGVTAHIRAIASSERPSELLIGEAKTLCSGLIVMGAYGHRGWREALLGSNTSQLLDECPTTLFVYH